MCAVPVVAGRLLAPASHLLLVDLDLKVIAHLPCRDLVQERLSLVLPVQVQVPQLDSARTSAQSLLEVAVLALLDHLFKVRVPRPRAARVRNLAAMARAAALLPPDGAAGLSKLATR